MRDLLLAHDLGTTGAKSTLFAANGEIVASEFRPYPTHYPQPGWAEQDPKDWWDAVAAATRTLLGSPGVSAGAIRAIGFSGHMMGCLPVDADGAPLRMSLLHSDTRSDAQARRLAERLTIERVYQLTGNIPDPHYPSSKIAWIKEEEPDVYARTARFIQCKDYIAGRLTGDYARTDASDASLYGLLDLRSRRWSDELVAGAGVDAAKLPEVCDSSTVVGKVTPEAAAETGLLAGTPVVIGGGDGACATIGAGATQAGDAYNYIGGTSWISAVSDEPIFDPKMRVFTLCDVSPGKYNVLGTVQCAGGAYEWFANNLGVLETAKAAESGVSRFQLLADLAGEAPPGAGGLIFLPYLIGERAPIWDPDARGVFFGLGLEHTRAHMARAVLEGVAFALRSILNIVEELGVSVASIRVIGGGAQGKFWREILACVYNRPVLVPANVREATSYGAAIAAGVGVGIYADYSVARSIVQIVDTHMPDPETAEVYARMAELYESLYPALKDRFAALAGIRNRD